jgi:hypothetical protein
LQTPDPIKPGSSHDSDDDPYAADFAAAEATAAAEKLNAAKAAQALEAENLDAQDNYVEAREPSELAFCVILAAAYAGLAQYFWQNPPAANGDWVQFVIYEVVFSAGALLSLLLGVRPYLVPSNLQIGQRGVKYRGPYWPQRKTVNWDQMFRLYLSPQLIIVLHRPIHKKTGVRLMIIQSSYLSDRDHIVESFAKYAMVDPTYMKNPDWITKGIFLIIYSAIIAWILVSLPRA